MSNVKARAEAWLDIHIAGWIPEDLDSLVILLKEQDRDTRHACASDISELDTVTLSDCILLGGAINVDKAVNVCMNIKAI